MIKEVERYVYGKIGKNAHFAVHVRRAAYYAVLLAKKYGIPREKAVAAALLHDIDGIVADSKTPIPRVHRMTRIFLRRCGYGDKFINDIFGVILTHGTHSPVKPRTKLEKAVASADGLSHYDMLPLYFYANGQRGVDFETAIANVQAKLERSDRKMSLAEARRLAKPLRRRAKELIDLVRTGKK